ncbi:MAG: hypothetical protein IH602_16340 [Bryobacteraceae bacterium]|nr:hypothetical protein [Bryobacteraceae bacterium]
MLKAILMACVVVSVPAAAQKVEKIERKVERKFVEGKPMNTMVFTGAPAAGGMRHTIAFKNMLVKGAPYAAESVTETVQILADGNRIVNKQSSKEYRDSEGRTRHDNTVAPLGPWVAEGKSMTISIIDDPVAGEHFTLNHEEKTANKMKMPRPIHVSEGVAHKEIEMEVRHEVETSVNQEIHVTATTGPKEAMTTGVLVAPRGGAQAMTWTVADAVGGGAANTEPLGKRVIEGVECEGTKETLMIEAGKIGNDRPIETVTERWHSPELKVDVLRKHSDPRFGTTEYRLQGIVRGEQPRSLFEAPSDYKVQEMGGAMTIKMRSPKQ